METFNLFHNVKIYTLSTNFIFGSSLLTTLSKSCMNENRVAHSSLVYLSTTFPKLDHKYVITGNWIDCIMHVLHLQLSIPFCQYHHNNILKVDDD